MAQIHSVPLNPEGGKDLNNNGTKEKSLGDNRKTKIIASGVLTFICGAICLFYPANATYATLIKVLSGSGAVASGVTCRYYYFSVPDEPSASSVISSLDYDKILQDSIREQKHGNVAENDTEKSYSHRDNDVSQHHAKHQAQDTQLQTQNRELQIKVTTYEKTISSQQTDITDLQNRIEELQAMVTSYEKTISSQQTDIANLQNRNEDLQAKVTSYETTISLQNTEIANLNAKIATCEEKARSQQTEIATLQAQNVELQTKMHELEKRFMEAIHEMKRSRDLY